MSILTVDPIPGAESVSAPSVGTPIRLEDLPSGIHLRFLDGSPVGVFYMGVGDTTPALRVQVVDLAGNPVVVTGCTCELLLKQRRTDVVVFQKDGVITAPVAGFLEYHWDSEDTLAGAYQARFILTDADGAQLTLPNSNGIYVEISAS